MLIIPTLLWSVSPAVAADDNLISGNLMDKIGVGAIVFILLLIIGALLVLLRALKIVTRLVLKSEGLTDAEIDAEMKPAKKVKEPKKDVWIKLLSLKPMAEEKEILIHKGPYFSLTMNSKFSEIKKQPFLPKRKSSRIKKPVCK